MCEEEYCAVIFRMGRVVSLKVSEENIAFITSILKKGDIKHKYAIRLQARDNGVDLGAELGDDRQVEACLCAEKLGCGEFISL